MRSLVVLLGGLLSLQALAYVPTVEGLFRHGNNPDVTTNAMVLSASISSYNPYIEKVENATRPLWVKWIYNVTPQGKLKLTQLIYNGPAMAEANLVDKTYVAELSPRSFNAAQSERGLLLSLFNSQLINDGSFMIDFLQQQGISVQANTEILNQDKIALLHRYRAWLSQNRGGKGADESPMNPANPADRERVTRLMSSPMYLDSQKVILSRHQGDPAWQVKVENFEAFVDDAQREVRSLILRRPAGDIEIVCRDPVLLNGSHRMPRQIIIKNAQDQHFQINLISLRHFNETGTDLVTRLKRYDQVLAHKKEEVERPAFLY